LSNIPLLSIEETLERMSGDRELLANLFQLYIDDAPKKLRSLHEHVGEADFYQVERIAHSLKGASATVGAARLSGLAAELEQAAKTGSRERLEHLYREVTLACDQTLQAMREFSVQA
jgi:histidine phosphotransfer protein HptB